MLKRKVYLDYASTTPSAPEVIEAMAPYLRETFGNPSSSHWFGRCAIKAVDDARETIARFLGASPLEIYFTGSATEADNLAIGGAIAALAKTVRFPKSNSWVPHVVTSAIEHEAVLEPCRALEKMGMADVTYVPVNREGIMDAEDVSRAIKSNTVLVSVMYANSEIGTIQPVGEIGRIIKQENERRAADYQKIKGLPRDTKYEIRNAGNRQRFPAPSEARGDATARSGGADEGAPATEERSEHEPIAEGEMANTKYPIRFHTDAVQAAQFLDCNVDRLNVDLLTLSAHKIYGPKGIGALYIRRGTPVEPIIRGGGQERGLRSGTENVPHIVGFAKAVRLIEEKPKNYNERFVRLRDYCIRGLLKDIPEAALNASRDQRLPNNVNIRIRAVAGETLIIALDQMGIAVSTGSACASRGLKPSHVLKAIGVDTERYGSVRLTLGRTTTKAEIDYTIKVMKEAVERLRLKRKN